MFVWVTVGKNFAFCFEKAAYFKVNIFQDHKICLWQILFIYTYTYIYLYVSSVKREAVILFSCCKHIQYINNFLSMLLFKMKH